MSRTAEFVILGLLLKCATAYNVDTDQSYQLYLRDGGSSFYGASQEPAYAGYTFDVRMQNNETHILVGQPRSGVKGQVISPGSLYTCNISFISEETGSGSESIQVTTTEATTLSPSTAVTSDATNVSSTSTYAANFTTVTMTTTEAIPTAFSIPHCEKVEVFDQMSVRQRGIDHKNNADALGLNLGKVGNAGHYAVCAPVRETSCPTNISYVPGACYYGMANQTGWDFLRWNETKCFDKIIEIMFVVDGSGSIKENNFNRVKDWLVGVIRDLIKIYGESVRTQVLQYSNKDRASLRLPIAQSKKFVIPYVLNDLLSAEEIEQKIRDMRYLEGQTFTYYALRRAMEVEFPNSAFNEQSKKIVIVLTDGVANDGTDLKSWHNKYKSEVTPFAVGVGAYNLVELRRIANGDTSNDRVLTVTNFEQLQTVISDLTGQIETTTQTEGATTTSSKSSADDTGNRKLGSAIASDKNGNLYLGAVGMYRDSGIVMRFNSTSDESFADTSFKQIEEALPNRTESSYLGYSVVTGFFDGKSGTEYVATGAPRYLLQGTVVIYDPKSGKGLLQDRVTIKAPEGRRQMGAYFGGCLLSLDVNGDGKDDLFVGSPLYVDSNYDEGRVFAYISQNTETTKTWADPSYSPTELAGDRSLRGRFGSAMADAGDMNLDGYNDVIIGAPLVDDGQGAVFIYHGMKNGITIVPSQKIAASTLKLHDLRYFGQSLQGNVDIDDNQYPDIFVGTPRSDSVVVLRSRAIVSITSSIKYTTAQVDILECMIQEYKNCTAIEFCFFAYGTSVDSPIVIDYVLRTDSSLRTTERRFEFSGSLATISQSLTLATNSTYCFTKSVNMKKNIKDYDSPITATLSFELASSHINAPFSSVRDRTLPNEFNATVDFFKHCKNDTCVPDLQIQGNMILPPFTKKKDGKEIDFTENGNVFIADETTSRTNPTVRLNFSNVGENAFDARVRIAYPKKFFATPVESISGFPTKSCIAEEGSEQSLGDSFVIREFSYQHELNIMRANSWCQFEFQLVVADTLKSDGVTDKFTIIVDSFTSSNSSIENDKTNNGWNKTIGIKYRSDLQSRRASSASGDQVIRFNYTTEALNISSVSEIGPGTPDIRVAFTIQGLGYSNIPLSELTLKWPWKTEEGHPLLYLYHLECKEKDSNVNTGKCVCDESNVNPYGLLTGLDGTNMTRVNWTVVPANKTIDQDELNCQEDSGATHECESLNCTVRNLDDSTELLFTATFRLWVPSISFNETRRNSVALLTDFEIATANSSLSLNKDLETAIVLTQQVTTTARKFFASNVDEANDEWILPVIITASVLFVALLFFIAYRCGLFGNKYQQMLEDEKQRLDDETDFPEKTEGAGISGKTYENVKMVDAAAPAFDGKYDEITMKAPKSHNTNKYDELEVIDVTVPIGNPSNGIYRGENVYLNQPTNADDEPDYDLPPNGDEDEALPPPPPII